MKSSLWIVVVLVSALIAQAQEPRADSRSTPTEETLAQRGYRLLTSKPYLSPDFDQETFDQLWRTWEEPLRSQAAAATLEERRQMAFSRYGLTNSPGRESPVALQYVDDGQGGWVMNCFSCHAGKVAGQVIPGLPNAHFALETLTAEVRETKLRLSKKLSRMDVGGLFMPLGTTNGTTNAVMFGVVLLAKRDADLNLKVDNPNPQMTHHDHDAPPWWHAKKKKNLYIDGFAAKGHRPLMQFLLTPGNGPEKFREWEDDYRAIEAYIESVEAPQYPFAIDRAQAAAGEKAFNRTCARCHGTYGEESTYPEKITPIAEVGTDRVRLDALTPEARAHYDQTWFTDYGEKKSIVDPGGYVAPPLDGIWASAPYLHNGSVPTLWHLLHPTERAVVWQRTENGYDQENVGLEVTTFDSVPNTAATAAQQHRYFDTRRFGKSAAGHLFPDELSEKEKRAVLEYLKTL